MRKTLSTMLWMTIVYGACIAQSKYKNELQPGVSTRSEAIRVLGRPMRTLSATLFEYTPPAGAEKLLVEYRRGSEVIERIESHFIDPVSRDAMIAALKLPQQADARKTNAQGKLVEYFGQDALVLTYSSAEARSGVKVLGYYSRELFEAAAPQLRKRSSSSRKTGDMARAGEIKRANKGGISWGPIQQASINQGDGELLTYYGGTTPEQCQADCDKNPRCKAFTFIRPGAYSPNDPQMCYLMSQVQKLTPSTCCISAVKNEEQR